MNPLDFIERLFNARACERELATTKAALEKCQSEKDELAKTVKELQEINHRLESSTKTTRRPFAISDDHPDGY